VAELGFNELGFNGEDTMVADKERDGGLEEEEEG
jgi:hypothetical protein